jgi:hypothetical protein
MNTIYKSMVVILILIGLWIALASTGHCETPCHPGQHTCTTDAECEAEETKFQAQDNKRWINIDKHLNKLPVPKELAPTTIKEVK